MTLARLKLLSDHYAFDATPQFNDVGREIQAVVQA